MNRLLSVALLACIGLAACAKKEEAAVASAPPVSSAAAPNTGKVVQVVQAGGYTYAEVDAGGGQKVWMAGAPIQVKAGDSVQWGDYAVMKNFNSKTLGRTFEQILFVNAWGPAGGTPSQVAPHGVMPGSQAAMASHAQMAPMADADGGVNRGEVKSVAAAAGYTYLEISQNGAIIWVAAPEMTVKAGDKVAWNGGAEMQNFTAKALGRTFDRIIFAGKVSVVQ